MLKTTTHTKTYQHYRVNTLEKQSPEDARAEFFYIGSDKAKIEILIQAFGTGYAPETTAAALALLRRMPALRSKPAFIIVDGQLGEQTLRDVCAALDSNAEYETIPLILDASELDEQSVTAYRRPELLDEIIFIKNEDPESLQKRITFLRKFKKTATARSLGSEIPVHLRRKWIPRAVTKRAFDIVFSSFAIAFLLPVFVVIAILVKLESRGPVFYISKRAGRGYRVFDFIKFRTMVPDAEQSLEELWHLNRYKSKAEGKSIFFKGDNDPRVTRIGLFLRRTSLDELPQLFNVLLGDMSLVGNRPLPLVEAVSLTTDEWAARFLAPAGMTGLWQIRRKGKYDMTVEQRINLDIAYAHKYNFLYDLWIMANTPAALIQRSNS